MNLKINTNVPLNRRTGSPCPSDTCYCPQCAITELEPDIVAPQPNYAKLLKDIDDLIHKLCDDNMLEYWIRNEDF